MQGKKLGFIGVGQLAQPMVKHLLEQVYEVLVHNGRRDPLERLISKGAIYSPCPEDAVIEGGILFNCLPDGAGYCQYFMLSETFFSNSETQGFTCPWPRFLRKRPRLSTSATRRSEVITVRLPLWDARCRRE
jgi:hypothetical protein